MLPLLTAGQHHQRNTMAEMTKKTTEKKVSTPAPSPEMKEIELLKQELAELKLEKEKEKARKLEAFKSENESRFDKKK